MGEARAMAEWDRAAMIAAMVHNAQCTRRSDMLQPGELNPLRRMKTDVYHRTKDLGILRRMYVDRKA